MTKKRGIQPSQRSICDFYAPSSIEEVSEVKIEIKTELLLCPICNFDLTKFTVDARSVHVNRCIDPPHKTKTLLSQSISPKKRKNNEPGITFSFESSCIKSELELAQEDEPFLANTTQKSTIPKIPKIPKIPRKAKAKKPRARKPRAPIPNNKILKFPPQSYNTIAVDAFNYAIDPEISIYLLTHFHSDHYGGMTKSWDNGSTIIVTEVTGKLLMQKFKIPIEKLLIIENFNVPTKIPGTDITITALDANHCPGSGIYVLECNGVKYLHCGDFRVNKDMIKSLLKFDGFDKCYLDTTYLDPKYVFPKQEIVIDQTSNFLKELSVGYKTNQKRVLDFFTGGKDVKEFLIVIGTYLIGKERLAIGIAEALGSKIYCPPEKWSTMQLYGWDNLNRLVDTDNPKSCQVHLMPIMKTKKELLVAYIGKYSSKFKSVLVIRPTGWTFTYFNKVQEHCLNDLVEVDNNVVSKRLTQVLKREFKKEKGFTLFRKMNVPYSEHSSFRELFFFVNLVKCKEIITTVNMNRNKEQYEWLRRFQEYPVLSLDQF